MLAKKVLFLLAISVAALPFMACSAITGEEAEGEEEQEGVGQSNDELRSAVSCKERTDTAYNSGRPTPIQVIHIGGKPTSKATGHAFLKMQAAADAAGVHLSLTSGFRTNAEQTHLYNCYLNKNCNNGNLAARPGYSNHQNGLALDLSTSAWLTKNASKFGFVRTVPKEPWHFEYHGADPGGPCTRGDATTATPGADDDPADNTTPAPAGRDDDPNDNTPADTTPAAGGITWVAPAQDETLENGFTVMAHANKAGIVKIVYSQGTYVFGTSTDADNDFALKYTFMYMGDKTLTAKGFDANGALIAMDHVDFTLLP